MWYLLFLISSFTGTFCAFASSSSSPQCCSTRTDPVLKKTSANKRPLYGPLSWYADSSTFVDALLKPGDRFGARPILGDASRLRSSIQQALDYSVTGKVFKVVILGGSPAAGGECTSNLQYLLPGWTNKMNSSEMNKYRRENVLGAVPGIVDAGNFAFFRAGGPAGGRDRKDAASLQGDVQLCSWSARLARYMGETLFAEHRNFVVFNGAVGAADTTYHLMTAHNNFEERLTSYPPNGTWAHFNQTLDEDVDLILLDNTANDYQSKNKNVGAEDHIGKLEALVRYFLSLHHRKAGSAPTVALVQVPATNSFNEAQGKLSWNGVPHFHAQQRALADMYGLPVVDTVMDNIEMPGILDNPRIQGWLTGAADTEQTARERLNFIKSLSMHPLLKSILTKPGAGSRGFGHYNGAYHEWVAATVFYALLFPSHDIAAAEKAVKPLQFPKDPIHYNCATTNDNGRGAALCHIGSGSVSLFNFMDQQCDPLSPKGASRLMCKSSDVPDALVDPVGWKWGSDVSGKNGYISCDGPSSESGDTLGKSLAMTVKCELGDLILGYLKSYDRRMGCVEVIARRPPFLRSIIVDAWDPSVHESVYSMAILPGLDQVAENSTSSKGETFWTWSVEVVPVECPRAQGSTNASSGHLSSHQIDIIKQHKVQSKVIGAAAAARASHIDPVACTGRKFKVMTLACT